MTSGRRLTRPALLLAAALTAAACHNPLDPAKPSCDVGFIGDPGSAPELTLLARTSSNTMIALSNSAAVPLLTAPQGGFLVFAGARVNNMDGCGMTVNGALRDPLTNRVIGFEQRPVTLKVDVDGYGVPADPADLSDFANIPACPSSAATRSVVGSAYSLEVIVTDAGSRTKTQTLFVTPYCGEPGDTSYCEASCAPFP